METEEGFGELADKLRRLAERYETVGFTEGDPSYVLKRYSSRADVECAAFIAAMLAFGRRDQFLAKTARILDQADSAGGPAQWLSGEKFRGSFIPPGTDAREKFYRFYSWDDMEQLFQRLGEILRESSTLGNRVRQRHEAACAACAPDGTEPPHLSRTLCAQFPGCRIVPQGKDSANKRVHMFLRWMVRQNSPVDLGLWDWYSPADLLVPLDTHVIQEAVRLGLLPEKSAGTARTARLLTRTLRKIWPDDPCRGDFALFGLGVDGGREG